MSVLETHHVALRSESDCLDLQPSEGGGAPAKRDLRQENKEDKDDESSSILQQVFPKEKPRLAGDAVRSTRAEQRLLAKLYAFQHALKFADGGSFPQHTGPSAAMHRRVPFAASTHSAEISRQLFGSTHSRQADVASPGRSGNDVAPQNGMEDTAFQPSESAVCSVIQEQISSILCAVSHIKEHLETIGQDQPASPALAFSGHDIERTSCNPSDVSPALALPSRRPVDLRLSSSADSPPPFGTEQRVMASARTLSSTDDAIAASTPGRDHAAMRRRAFDQLGESEASDTLLDLHHALFRPAIPEVSNKTPCNFPMLAAFVYTVIVWRVLGCSG